MADIDVGQLANSLTAQFQIFFQERRRREGETKADARFEKQHELFLQSRELDRQRETRLATESQARIANQKVDRDRAQMIMWINMAREVGVDITLKAARGMGAKPEQLEFISTLTGIQAASRAPISSTSAFQSVISLGGTFAQAVDASNDPQSFDDSTLPGKRTSANPLNRDIIELVKSGTITDIEAPILDKFFDQETDDLSIEDAALIPGILAKIREGVEQTGIVDTKRFNEILGSQKRILDIEQAGGDISGLSVFKEQLDAELGALQTKLMSPERLKTVRQSKAARAKADETEEQRQKRLTRVQELEPLSGFGQKVEESRAKFKGGAPSLKDLAGAFIGGPALSIGKSLLTRGVGQSFRVKATGQIIEIEEGRDLELIEKAVEAGELEPISRLEAAAAKRARKFEGAPLPQPQRRFGAGPITP